MGCGHLKRDTLRSTQDEALRCKHVIDELQELALADAGRLTFDLRSLDAALDLQRAADAFQASAPAIHCRRPHRV